MSYRTELTLRLMESRIIDSYEFYPDGEYDLLAVKFKNGAVLNFDSVEQVYRTLQILEDYEDQSIEISL